MMEAGIVPARQRFGLLTGRSSRPILLITVARVASYSNNIPARREAPHAEKSFPSYISKRIAFRL
jgi:hypothetical protein